MPKALIRLGQWGELEPADVFKEDAGRVADAQQAQGVAGGVEGYTVRIVRAYVPSTQFVDEEHGELAHPWQEVGHLLLEPKVARQRGESRVVVVDHGHARGRGGHDDLGVPECRHEVADQWDDIAPVAAVEVHLAAAGLRLREIHLVTEALEHLDDRPAGSA